MTSTLSDPVEAVPASWLGPLEYDDRLVFSAEGLEIRLAGRVAVLGPGVFSRGEVWRGPDGVRRNRLVGPDGNELALLHDQHWRLPEGRLAPLLEAIGCPVRSVDPPEGPHDAAGQQLGRAPGLRRLSRRPVPGSWVVVLALALLMTVLAAAVTDSGAFPASRAGVVGACGVLSAVLVVAAGMWLRSLSGVVPALPSAAARPLAGSRHGWRHGAGLAASEGRLHVWDGWGRVAVLPRSGPLTPSAVCAGEDAAVVVGAGGRAVLRLPHASWAGSDEQPAHLARRVAEAAALPVADRPAPAGGQEVGDPDPPSPALTVMATVALAVPLFGALVMGLFADRRFSPDPVAWIPAAAGLVAVLGSLVRSLSHRARLGRGGRRRGVRLSWAALWRTYPLWAGAGLLLFPMTWIWVLPSVAFDVWVAVLAVVGLPAVLGAVRFGGGRGGRWSLATLVVPWFAAVLALAGRDVLPAWVLWLGLADGALALIVVVASLLGRRGRRPRG